MKKRGRVVDEDILSKTTLNMDGKQIINVILLRLVLLIPVIRPRLGFSRLYIP